MQNDEFRELIWQKAGELYRDMPWRMDVRPYYVLVSELMLQQTQVSRVIPKFEMFIAMFPDEQSLASASLADVLKVWQGLGYSRRAKFLHDAAKRIVNEFGGTFPATSADILSLPGVGKNTLGAIEAYAFNRPSTFIETNIRTVYIHHFFNDDFNVADTQIIKKIEETVPWATGKELPGGLSHYGPREFYWALMDYGSWLKANGVRVNSRSKQYKKQSPLEGSVRQVRGQILRALNEGDLTRKKLEQIVHADYRFEVALNGLLKDGLISESSVGFHLTK